MQDRNAKAPKVRSGDQINPVLGTIIKISIILVIVALITLTTLIIIEFVKRNKKTVDVFEDRIHITEEDFYIITNGEAYDDLSKEVNDVMINYPNPAEVDIYFFFYYSDLLDAKGKDQMDKELITIVGNRKEDQPLFLINLSEVAEEDENGNKEPLIIDYIRELEDLKPSAENEDGDRFEIDVLLHSKKNYPYFLLKFNEEVLAEGNNPFVIDVDLDKIKTILEQLDKKPEEKK